MSNNNISIPLSLFGPSYESRILPEKVQLYANVGGRQALELGSYHVRVSAQVRYGAVRRGTAILAACS